MLIFLKNDTRKYGIFFKLSEKMVFSNKATLGHDLSCIIQKDGIFLIENIFFFLGQEVRGNLSQEVHGNMIFAMYTTGVTNVAPCPCIKKKIKDGLIPQIYTPKGDCRSRLTTQKDLLQLSVLSWRPLQLFSCIALQRIKSRIEV